MGGQGRHPGLQATGRGALNGAQQPVGVAVESPECI